MQRLFEDRKKRGTGTPGETARRHRGISPEQRPRRAVPAAAGGGDKFEPADAALFLRLQGETDRRSDGANPPAPAGRPCAGHRRTRRARGAAGARLARMVVAADREILEVLVRRVWGRVADPRAVRGVSGSVYRRMAGALRAGTARRRGAARAGAPPGDALVGRDTRVAARLARNGRTLPDRRGISRTAAAVDRGRGRSG